MPIRVKKHLPSGTIILDRPDRKNALSPEMVDAIVETVTGVVLAATSCAGSTMGRKFT